MLKSAKMTKDLYDQIKENPESFLQIENGWKCKMGRGRRVKLNPLDILEVPDREVLRDNINTRYGISEVDNFFIPIVTDSATYRMLDGESDPSIFDGFEEYSRKSVMANGHVRKHKNYFLAYLCANLPNTDEGIDHEAIHAFMFKNNPHYRRHSPTFGPLPALPIPNEDRSWIEAVAWVGSSKECDHESVFGTYNGKQNSANRGFCLPGVKHMLYPLTIGLHIGLDVYDCVKGERKSDIPYVLSRNVLKAVHGYYSLSSNREKVRQTWLESFELAARLKQTLGVHEFIRLSGQKHRRELEEIAHG